MSNAVIPESNTNLDEMIKSVDEAVEYLNNVPLSHNKQQSTSNSVQQINEQTLTPKKNM